jgi:HK97 family phage portal protein
LSAWFRGRELLATALGMLPLPVFERLPNDAGANVAREHPLYDLLHDAPNEGQDAFTWRREAMYDVIDTDGPTRGSCQVPRGFADSLLPIAAPLVTPERLKGQSGGGRWLFHVRDEASGRTNTYTQDDIFYLRGAEGKGILARARESLGTAQATEAYAGRVYGKGMLSGGFLEIPGAAGEEANKNIAKSLLTAAGDWHQPKVLPMGATWKPNPLTPEDAQMLLSRKHSVDDVARWLGMPRMMLENNDPSFGNAEQFTQNLVTFSLGQWMSMWEFAINHQLMLNPRRFYAEFTRDALVRGDIATRWRAHVDAVNAGIKSVDEVRGVENLNKRGGKADELREPQNITGKPAAPDAAAAPPPPQKKPAPKPTSDKAAAIAQASASRLLRKEVAEVRKLAVKHAADGDAFAAAVTDFYARHVELVAVTLQMSAEEADRYCASQASQIVNGDWVAAVDTWSTESYAAGLAELALEETAA